MWISRLQVRGFAGHPDRAVDLGPFAVLEPGPCVDALALLVAAVAPSRRQAAVAWLGWRGTWSDGELQTEGTLHEIEARPHPTVVVEVDVRPDPPLFGLLRDELLRDPRAAEGLAEGTIGIKVGWTFTPDRRVGRPGLLGIRLGSVPVPLVDPPGWVDPVLVRIGESIAFFDPERPLGELAERCAAAVLSPERREREWAEETLREAGVEVVREGARYRFAMGASLKPLRWAAPDAGLRVRLAAVVLLERPDVMVVRAALPDDRRTWLEQLLKREAAPLEQVVLP